MYQYFCQNKKQWNFIYASVLVIISYTLKMY
jgi:hypothetical protein